MGAASMLDASDEWPSQAIVVVTFGLLQVYDVASNVPLALSKWS
jgi:hypothetical protein